MKYNSPEEYEKIIENVSDLSYYAYRDLVYNTDGFSDFFFELLYLVNN